MEQLFQSHNTPRKRVQITFPKKGKTKQSFKDQCDINLIIARHTNTGQLSHINNHEALYGYATSQDFAEAMRTVTAAQTSFNNLSDEIQTRFNGDPGQLLDFVQDPDNQAEGADLGLWPKDPIPEAGVTQDRSLHDDLEPLKHQDTDKTSDPGKKTDKPPLEE